MLKTAFKKFVAMACVLFLMVSLLGVSAFAADMHPRTLTYMGNGGVDAGGGTEFVYNYEEEDGKGTIIMPNGGDGFPNFAREGFKFIGWNTTADGSGTKYRGVLDDDTYSVVVDIPYSAFTNGALTLYAQWLPASDSGYMVRYEVNGGVTPSNKTFCDCPSDGPDKLLIVVPNEGFSDFSRKGYTFIGWNTKADGSGTKYNGLLEFSSYSSTIEIFPVDYVNNVFTLTHSGRQTAPARPPRKALRSSLKEK